MGRQGHRAFRRSYNGWDALALVAIWQGHRAERRSYNGPVLWPMT